MDFTRLGADEVLLSDGFEYHKRGMEFFHLQLAALNSSLFIMEHVIAFPYHLFVQAHDSMFFRLVFNNFFTSSVLAITRLLTDQGPQFFTLPRFKNRIRASIKARYSTQYDAYLRSLRFDTSTRALLRKAEALRNARLAHLLEEAVFQPNAQEALDFAGLKTLRDRTNSLLQGLAFNTDLLMLPAQYSDRVKRPPSADARPDIEKLLDLIARNSRRLNLPETNPDLWMMERRYTSESDLNLMNRYRAKFGMSPV
jgi:hypothetical protein